MKLSSNTNKTLWYVKDEDDKIIFSSMFKDACEEYIVKKGARNYD